MPVQIKKGAGIAPGKCLGSGKSPEERRSETVAVINSPGALDLHRFCTAGTAIRGLRNSNRQNEVQRK